MHQGYSYGGMPMPMPQHSAQNVPVASTRPNVNATPYGGKSKTDSVLSILGNQLDQADQSELQELFDKEEKLHRLLNENIEVKQAQVEREMQLAQNRSLAESNMTKGTKLDECKQKLGVLYDELNEQTKLFDENKSNLESLATHYKPDTILALLQTSVAQLEETTEKMADSFLEGNVSVDDFLEKYVKEREQLHVRRTKVDKMKELMRH